MPYSAMDKPKVGDKVIFGRKRGEKTRGTVIKVNRTKAKVRQDESRGTMKAYPVGNIWTVPFGLMEPDPTGGLADAVEGVTKAVEGLKERVSDPVIGSTIVDVRPMTDAELDTEGWEVNFHGRPLALVLSNGSVLYASQDPEGNGPGALFGTDAKGKGFGLVAVKAS